MGSKWYDEDQIEDVESTETSNINHDNDVISISEVGFWIEELYDCSYTLIRMGDRVGLYKSSNEINSTVTQLRISLLISSKIKRHSSL